MDPSAICPLLGHLQSRAVPAPGPNTDHPSGYPTAAAELTQQASPSTHAQARREQGIVLAAGTYHLWERLYLTCPVSLTADRLSAYFRSLTPGGLAASTGAGGRSRGGQPTASAVEGESIGAPADLWGRKRPRASSRDRSSSPRPPLGTHPDSGTRAEGAGMSDGEVRLEPLADDAVQRPHPWRADTISTHAPAPAAGEGWVGGSESPARRPPGRTPSEALGEREVSLTPRPALYAHPSPRDRLPANTDPCHEPDDDEEAMTGGEQEELARGAGRRGGSSGHHRHHRSRDTATSAACTLSPLTPSPPPPQLRRSRARRDGLCLTPRPHRAAETREGLVLTPTPTGLYTLAERECGRTPHTNGHAHLCGTGCTDRGEDEAAAVVAGEEEGRRAAQEEDTPAPESLADSSGSPWPIPIPLSTATLDAARASEGEEEQQRAYAATAGTPGRAGVSPPPRPPVACEDNAESGLMRAWVGGLEAGAPSGNGEGGVGGDYVPARPVSAEDEPEGGTATGVDDAPVGPIGLRADLEAAYRGGTRGNSSSTHCSPSCSRSRSRVHGGRLADEPAMSPKLPVAGHTPAACATKAVEPSPTHEEEAVRLNVHEDEEEEAEGVAGACMQEFDEVDGRAPHDEGGSLFAATAASPHAPSPATRPELCRSSAHPTPPPDGGTENENEEEANNEEEEEVDIDEASPSAALAMPDRAAVSIAIEGKTFTWALEAHGVLAQQQQRLGSAPASSWRTTAALAEESFTAGAHGGGGGGGGSAVRAPSALACSFSLPRGISLTPPPPRPLSQTPPHSRAGSPRARVGATASAAGARGGGGGVGTGGGFSRGMPRGLASVSPPPTAPTLPRTQRHNADHWSRDYTTPTGTGPHSSGAAPSRGGRVDDRPVRRVLASAAVNVPAVLGSTLRARCRTAHRARREGRGAPVAGRPRPRHGALSGVVRSRTVGRPEASGTGVVGDGGFELPRTLSAPAVAHEPEQTGKGAAK